LHHQFDRRRHMIKLFCSLNVNRLNILHWKCTTADKFFVCIFIKWLFQRKIRFWSKIYNNWKVTLLPVFLENSEPKNWTRAQILTILKQTVIQTY